MSTRRIKAVPDTVGPDMVVPETHIWILPRTAEAYDAMVEQMVVSIFRADDEPHWNRANIYPHHEKHARAALRAIGITRPKAERGNK